MQGIVFPGASNKRYARYSSWWQDGCSDAIQQSSHGIGSLAGDIKVFHEMQMTIIGMITLVLNRFCSSVARCVC
jgi:hypothetical protein